MSNERVAELAESVGDKQPKMILTSDPELLAQLQAKLLEYQERLLREQADQPHRHPDINGSLDTKMKIGILGALLDRQELPLWDYSLEFGKEHRSYIGLIGFDGFQEAWNRAASVINDYNETGGQQNRSGTGLPETTS